MAITGTETELAQRWRDLFASSGIVNVVNDSLYNEIIDLLAQGVIEHIEDRLQISTVISSGSSAGTYTGDAI